MELRKIQRTSGGTFFVCLPKGWAEKNGIARGSIVALSETADGRLTINPKYGLERTLDVATLEPTPLLDREIVEKYLSGFDIIHVEAQDRISPDNREIVKKASSRLVGLEIVEENYSKIVMQCLLEPSSFPPEKILRREYSIASGMHRDAVTAIVEGDVHLAKNVVARDNEVNRLYFLLVRILRTIIQNPKLSDKLGIRPIDCLDYRLAASLVESIGDWSAEISEEAVKLGGAKMVQNLSQLITNLHRIAYESHENAVEAFFSRDVSVAESVRAEKGRIAVMLREIEVAAQAQPVEVVPQVLAVASSVSGIYDNSLDIADLVMPRLL